MMINQRVPVVARVSPEERRELREILMRGGLTVQDFLGACVRAGLNGRPVNGNGHPMDPVDGVGYLRNRTPSDYAELARQCMGVSADPAAGEFDHNHQPV